MISQPVQAVLERYKEVIPDWQAFLAACSAPLDLTAWTHPDRPGGARHTALDGFQVTPIAWRPGARRLNGGPSMADSLAYRAGLIHVQEESSMLPASMLAAQPGERVLDLCAAPGNKSAELALALGGRGTLIANDRSGGRLNVLRTTLDRLGLPNATLTCRDGRSPTWPSAHFDAVLVDAPCSCEGTLRKHPDAPVRTETRHRTALTAVQRDLLANALRMTRPGGRVVYATCTFAPEENELVVADVLADNPDVHIEPFSRPGLNLDPGITQWKGRTLPATMRHAVRLWPHRSDTGGFFAVILRKPPRGEAAATAPAHGDGAGPTPHEVGRARKGPAPPARHGFVQAGRGSSEELQGLLGFLSDSFGLAQGWWRAYRFRLGKNLDVLASDHDAALPFRPEPWALSLARLTGRVPKLTTAGALLLGTRITRSWVDLPRTAAFDYFRGRDVPLNEDCIRPRYVQVRCLGTPVGVGRLTDGGRRLESLYPRAWGGLGRPTS